MGDIQHRRAVFTPYCFATRLFTYTVLGMMFIAFVNYVLMAVYETFIVVKFSKLYLDCFVVAVKTHDGVYNVVECVHIWPNIIIKIDTIYSFIYIPCRQNLEQQHLYMLLDFWQRKPLYIQSASS